MEYWKLGGLKSRIEWNHLHPQKYSARWFLNIISVADDDPKDWNQNCWRRKIPKEISAQNHSSQWIIYSTNNSLSGWNWVSSEFIPQKYLSHVMSHHITDTQVVGKMNGETPGEREDREKKKIVEIIYVLAKMLKKLMLWITNSTSSLYHYNVPYIGRGGRVYRDPKKWLPKLWMNPDSSYQSW